MPLKEFTAFDQLDLLPSEVAAVRDYEPQTARQKAIYAKCRIRDQSYDCPCVGPFYCQVLTEANPLNKETNA